MNLHIFRTWRLIPTASTWSYWEQPSSLWPSQKDTLQKSLGWQSTSWGRTNGLLPGSLLLELKSIWSTSKRNFIAGTAFLWIVPLPMTLLETSRECYLSWLDMVMPDVYSSSGKVLCFKGIDLDRIKDVSLFAWTLNMENKWHLHYVGSGHGDAK